VKNLKIDQLFAEVMGKNQSVFFLNTVYIKQVHGLAVSDLFMLV